MAGNTVRKGVGRLDIEERKYRHEQKYCCTKGQFAVIRNTIKGLMQIDSHGDENGSYHIRSLYFDDYKDSGWYENEDGVSPREKYRIRIYNNSTKNIYLELKRKERGKTHKDSCRIEKELCRRIMDTGKIPYADGKAALYQKFYTAGQVRMLKPKVIVEYDRTVFVHKDGNVRVTYDENISSSRDTGHFFEPRLKRRPVMACGQGILEVKYDEFLPDVIYHALQFGNLSEITFSKYYYCRKFG